MTIPNSVTIIEDGTFRGCFSLTDVIIPNSVIRFGENVFDYCNLTSITILATVPPTLNQTFGIMDKSECTLYVPKESIELYRTADEWNEFEKMQGIISVNGVYYSEDMSTLLKYSEDNTGSFDVPGYVTKIGNNAFVNCSGLTSVSIPVSVTNIGHNAFAGCAELTDVYIATRQDDGAQSAKKMFVTDYDNSVISIGDYAFNNCPKLANIYSFATIPPTVGNEVFTNGQYGAVKVYVPTGCVDTYKKANGWSDFYYISEFSPTGIENMTTDVNGTDAEYYDLITKRHHNTVKPT